MKQLKLLSMTVVIVAILFASLGFSTQTAQAASCATYHTVKRGESLSIIGSYYGVNWKSIANANGIKSPYTIYTGQKLCIPSSGYTNISYTPAEATKSFSVIGVVEGTSVTIKTANFPDNMLYSVEIGCSSCGTAAEKVADLDSDAGGTFKKVFTIPSAFSGVSALWVRLTQVNNNDTLTEYFTNATVYGSTGKYTYNTPCGYQYCGVPMIYIDSVVRNSTVTFHTYNFPAGLTFDVLMGPMGSHGVNGYSAGSFNSGSGGTLTLTFAIPTEMHGASKIAIRVQNTSSGYYAYNWFYNNTAY
jgi:LysM repeat protein